MYYNIGLLLLKFKYQFFMLKMYIYIYIQIMNNRCLGYNISNNNSKIKCKKKKEILNFCSDHYKEKKYHIMTLNKMLGITNGELKKINNELQILKKFKNVEKIYESINKRNKILDEKYGHNLLGLYSSWSEINIENQIKLDDDYWDLDIIIHHIAEQINNSSLENAFPLYPSNPFNRKLFSVNSLINLNCRIKLLNKPINIATSIFLNSSEKVLKKSYYEATKKIAYKNDDKKNDNIMYLLSRNLRFKIVNNKNSQNLYTGIWVNKNEEENIFEKLYYFYKEIPFYLYPLNSNPIENPQKKKLGKILDEFPK
jgi:hypothetical protein